MDDVSVLGLQLCSVLRYLHASGILHRDLKPSNIVRDWNRVKVIDLSLAVPPGPSEPEIGTPQYMAPEQVRGGELTGATDVWGAGAVLYEAATGVPPFGGDRNTYEQLKRRAAPVRSLRRGAPRPFAEAIDRCLEPDPGRRPSLVELAEALARFVSGPLGAWYARAD